MVKTVASMNDQGHQQYVASAEQIALGVAGYQEWLLDNSLPGTTQLAEAFGFRAANVMKTCGIVNGSQLVIYGRKALARERGVGPVILGRVDSWLLDFASEVHAKWIAS